MTDPEFVKLQQAMKAAATPEEKLAAAAAFQQYVSAEQEARASLKKKRTGSTPTFVSLKKLEKPYPVAVKLKDIPEEIVVNPEYYDLLQKVITTTS